MTGQYVPKKMGAQIHRHSMTCLPFATFNIFSAVFYIMFRKHVLQARKGVEYIVRFMALRLHSGSYSR